MKGQDQAPVMHPTSKGAGTPTPTPVPSGGFLLSPIVLIYRLQSTGFAGPGAIGWADSTAGAGGPSVSSPAHSRRLNIPPLGSHAFGSSVDVGKVPH